MECFEHSGNFLKALESGRYDEVVVTEDPMTRMNWTELALKVRDRTPAIKILIVADLVKKELIEAKQRRIIDDYLPKSAGYQEIGAKVDRLAKST